MNKIFKDERDLWRLTIVSRLLFSQLDDYEFILRHKVKEMSKIDDENEVMDIFERMNTECQRQSGYGLSYMLNAYYNASLAYKDSKLWGKRRSKSKKDFCLKLFIKKYSPNTPRIRNLLRSMPGNYEDETLLDSLTEVDENGMEKVDVCFLLLISWGVVNPFKERNKNDKNDNERLDAMSDLFTTLDDYLKGEIGICSNFRIVKITHQEFLDRLEHGDAPSVAELWSMVDIIGKTMKDHEIESISNDPIECERMPLSGIWIDDVDKGENRFWVFPINLKMAFQYTKSNSGWTLLPFEFVCFKPDVVDSDTWYCVMVTAKANEELVLGGKASNDEIVYSDYEFETSETGDYPIKLSFKINGAVPEWHKWQCFLKLSEEDPKYLEYKRELEELYPEQSILAKDLMCYHKWMIDMRWALVAIDHDYLYVSDLKSISNYRMISAGSVSHSKDMYGETDKDDYVYMPSTSNQTENLRDIEISKEQPIYIIPRDVKTTCTFVKYTEKEDYETFRDIVKFTNYGDQITIYKIQRNGKVQEVICFNKFSRVFELKKIMSQYGVKKFTSKRELFNL